MFCPRLRFRPEGPFSGSPGRSPGSGAPPKLVRKAWRADFKECVVARSCTAFQVLTHLALLKPALQAWGCLWASKPGALAPGSAEIGPSGLVRASGARCRFRGVVWASGPRFVGWACPRLRFRPEGPFSVSPGRSPGWQGPQKSWFLGLKGRFQGDCGCAVMHGVPGAHAPGSAETGPSGLVRASGSKCGFRGVVWASGPRFVCATCPLLRFRPEGPFSRSPGQRPRDSDQSSQSCS